MCLRSVCVSDLWLRCARGDITSVNCANKMASYLLRPPYDWRQDPPSPAEVTNGRSSHSRQCDDFILRLRCIIQSLSGSRWQDETGGPFFPRSLSLFLQKLRLFISAQLDEPLRVLNGFLALWLHGKQPTWVPNDSSFKRLLYYQRSSQILMCGSSWGFFFLTFLTGSPRRPNGNLTSSSSRAHFHLITHRTASQTRVGPLLVSHSQIFDNLHKV